MKRIEQLIFYIILTNDQFFLFIYKKLKNTPIHLNIQMQKIFHHYSLKDLVIRRNSMNIFYEKSLTLGHEVQC